ncbi:MAG: ATP-binding protein [Rhodobacteraceae bacterium]|nr:ATP-binding protein [Paracoccaceae bacterium]MCY4139079.1 ATP-binding protein [Paracoccaceae bacterium]
MPRLFRKFLAIIWLTVIGSVVVVALILNAFQASPVTSQLELQKREIALDLARAILVEEGEAAALQFMATSEQALQLGLVLSSAAADDPCTSESAENWRAVPFDGTCYLIAVSEPEGLVPVRLAPVMLGLTVLLSSVLVAYLLARILINPVVYLHEGLSALAKGRFDVRIGDKLAARQDEIAALANDFDATARRLQENRDAQQRLFHDVSHELRSPLSRLRAVTGILRKTPARLDAMLDRVDREVERLDTLVGKSLVLARLTDRSEVPLKTQRLDVIEVLNDILADAAFEAKAHGVSITTDVDGSFLADVDGELIYRALENVIRNATKYTAEESRVSVRCDVAADLLTVQVTDQGPGVGRDELDRIFLPFSRGANALPRGGSGLGLAIARRAVERHGGRVTAELPQGGGLAITLDIPRYPTTRNPRNGYG